MTELAKFNQYPQKNALNDQDLFLIYSESESFNNTLSANTLADYIKEKSENKLTVNNHIISLESGGSSA